ncbi:MAG: YaaR family protein [Treponema sp.]|jgi:uncharacterized protein YaaR (DUF327 family)|nr:YaaR family protein [Treponema sp.]
MDKVDFGNNPAALLNSRLFGGAKSETRKSRAKGDLKESRGSFSDLFGHSLDAAAELGLPVDVPFSEEATQELLDAVHSAGDDLKKRPFPEEILRYKQAVRNFLHYVLENGFSVETGQGIPNKQKPGYQGPLWEPHANEAKQYHSVRIVDRKLEELAAGVLAKQISELDLKSRLDEIRGLLIDFTITGKITTDAT